MNIQRTIVSLSLILILILSGPYTRPIEAQTPVVRRFGFTFVGIGGLIVERYSADQFFDGMFLTPPYPATVQLGIFKDSEFVSNNPVRQFAVRVVQRAGAYPNIKLGFALSFDVRSEASWLDVASFLSALKSAEGTAQPIGFVGFSFEQVSNRWSSLYPLIPFTVADQTVALNRMETLVESFGWQFISYYPTAFDGTATERQQWKWLAHSAFPNSGSGGSIDTIGPEFVGQDAGSDGGYFFPSPACNFTGMPTWSLRHFPDGFTDPNYPPPAYAPCSVPSLSVFPNGFPPTIRYIFDRAALKSVVYRQWVLFIAGNMRVAHGVDQPRLYFTGVSGLSTTFLWDHPGFRNEMNNWILENPGTFLQGTSAVPPTPLRYTLTVLITPLNGGSVSLSPVVANNLYDVGTSITVIASPNTGYQFSGWLLNGLAVGGSATSLPFAITGSSTVEAQFSQIAPPPPPPGGGSFPPPPPPPPIEIPPPVLSILETVAAAVSAVVSAVSQTLSNILTWIRLLLPF